MCASPPINTGHTNQNKNKTKLLIDSKIVIEWKPHAVRCQANQRATRQLEMGRNLVIRIYKITIGNYSSINAECFAVHTYISYYYCIYYKCISQGRRDSTRCVVDAIKVNAINSNVIVSDLFFPLRKII